MLIGIVGKAGSGKDTVADFLVKNHLAYKMAFADPLKVIVQKTMGFTDEQLWGPSEKRSEPHPSGQEVWVCAHCGWFGQNPRQDPDKSSRKGWVLRCARCLATPVQQPLTARLALQTLGTDWGRALFPDIWALAGVSLALEVLAGQGVHAGARKLPAHKPERVVFSDCRFLNEAEVIKREGGQVWRVKRPNVKDAGGLGASHPSEAEQDLIQPDVTVNNNSNLDKLEEAVNYLVHHHMWHEHMTVDVSGGGVLYDREKRTT